LQIHYLLVVRNGKHKEIFSYYWHDKLKLNLVWCRFFVGFFNGFYPENLVDFLGITQVSEPCQLEAEQW